MTTNTKCLGTVICLKCGKIGALKRRTNRKNMPYYQVDHFKKGNSHASGYAGSCYLGLCDDELTLKLEKMKKKPNKKIAKIEVYPAYPQYVRDRIKRTQAALKNRSA